MILEMNEYPDGWTDIPNGYADTAKWRSTLLELGWEANHLYIVNGELTREVVEAAVYHLIARADNNDVVFFYIAAHGLWLRYMIEWNDWFPALWEELVSEHKLLIVSSCLAGEFTGPVEADPNPHVSIAAVNATEYSWSGIPSEGLPIIGCVMTHYLSAAFQTSYADINDDDDVSVEEAFAFAYPQIREYYNETVYPAFPASADLNNGEPPHPQMDDAYHGELSLQVELSIPAPLVYLWIAVVGLVVACVLVIVVVVWRRNRRS